MLNAAEQAADQVVGSLQSQGFAWLKLSESETCTFHQLQRCTKQPGGCFDQAGVLLRDKALVQYNIGNPKLSLPSAMCTVANRVSVTNLSHAWAVQSCCQSPDSLVTARLILAHLQVCELMDHHARRILQAICRSRYMGLASSSLNCILNKDDSISGQTASSCLDIAQYKSPSQNLIGFKMRTLTVDF